MTKEIYIEKNKVNHDVNLRYNNKEVGCINFDCKKQNAQGQINNKRYQFKAKRWFSKDIEIIDLQQNSTIGSIENPLVNINAKITVNSKTAQIKPKWLGFRGWQIKDTENKDVLFQGKYRKKYPITIDENADDALVLSGVFMSRFFMYDKISFNWYLPEIVCLAFFIIILHAI